MLHLKLIPAEIWFAFQRCCFKLERLTLEQEVTCRCTSAARQSGGGGWGGAEPPRGHANYFMSNLISGTQTFHSQRSAGERKSLSAAPRRLFLIRRQRRKKKGWDLTPWWPGSAETPGCHSLQRAGKSRNSLRTSEWETRQAVLLQAKEAIAPSHSNSNASLGEDGGNKFNSSPEVRFGVGADV